MNATLDILLVEDEIGLAKVVSYQLQKRGHVVEVCERGDAAVDLVVTGKYDLVILDVMLPGLSGIDVCIKLRALGSKVYILMLTALGELSDRVHGFEVGADDYLAKPFSIEELLARVQAFNRRIAWQHKPLETALRLDSNLEFDPIALELRKYGENPKTATLTVIESKLFSALLAARGLPVNRSQLLKVVWGVSQTTQTRTLDMFVTRLRQHLCSLDADPMLIESVRGVGYRLSASEKPSPSN